MIGYIILAIWLLSAIIGGFSFAVWKLLNEEWAELPAIICTVLFIGIPFVFFAAILLAGADWLSESVKNLLG